MSGVDCAQALTNLGDYLKQELTPELMVEVRQHLERCRDCFKHAQFQESFLSMLEKRAGRETCPAKLRARILGLLRSEMGNH
jgi:mycothiol system anti-sigma-R factor